MAVNVVEASNKWVMSKDEFIFVRRHGLKNFFIKKSVDAKKDNNNMTIARGIRLAKLKNFTAQSMIKRPMEKRMR